MKRHSSLIKLSQEHHHTLAVCVRILRAPDQNHQADITEHFLDLEKHFCEEETQFAPLWEKLADANLQGRFEHDHAKLRDLFHHARFDDAAWNTEFATTLRDHCRFEERELFPALEQRALPQE